jgi:hypothetical protein
MERPARTRQPQHEQPQPGQHPGDHGVEFAEVNLSLRAGQVRLRHADLGPVQAEVGAAAGHIPRHRHLRQRRAMLGGQPLPDPPGRMPLLARHVLVGQQPAINHLRIRVDRRPRPLRIGLPRRRHRRVQRLPHRPPVHMVPAGQLPDRGTPGPAVFPDLLEQFHSRPRHSQTSAPATSTQRSEPRVGPEFVTTRRPTTQRDHHPGGAKIREERRPSRGQFR